ncbi:MAG: haloacid dehalogenase type II [Rhizobiaceae bacterium]
MYSTYVFDAYGTLFDVHAAARRHADAVGGDHAALSEVWRQKQLEFTWTRTLMDRYVDFWELTQQALDFAFEKFPNANGAARQRLLDAYWELEAFAEVRGVLKALKDAGKRTAILSNGSSGMLNAAIESAGLADVLDASISVDRLNRFKAVPAVYQMVCDDFGIGPGDVSFQSSNRWDVAGAKAFGFRTVWCNRGGLPDEYRDLPPDMVVSDLNGLIGADETPA